MQAIEMLDTGRIDYLLNRELTERCTITVAGLGSGGAPVIQLLAMCGIRNWSLFDPDSLAPVNLVKHPGLRSQLGQAKVEILRDWLLDRNPACSVTTYPVDVKGSEEFRRAVAASDLVLCAVDNAAARSFINEVCVELNKPCGTGMVFRTGFGGQVYFYLPGVSGCYSCFERYCDRHGANFDDVIDLNEEEQEHLYGLNDKTFSASGLAVDINLISSLHAHMSLSCLAGRKGTPIPPLSFNCLTFGTRVQKGVFESRYEAQRLLLRPQADCHLLCGGAD